MKLYHGTAASNVEQILAVGIEPRAHKPSMWAAESNADCVYLTNAYSLHYAVNAAAEADDGLAIIEVDADFLTNEALLADEDALAGLFSLGKLDIGRAGSSLRNHPFEEQVRFFARNLKEMRDGGFGHEASLSTIGNCSHLGTVSTEAISRVITYPRDGGWRMQWFDPVISVQNYAYCGPEYRAVQMVTAGRTAEITETLDYFGMPIPVDRMEADFSAFRSLRDLRPASMSLSA